MMEEEYGRMIIRYIPDHMLEGQLVKQLAEHRYRHADATGKIVLIHRHRI